MLLQVILLFNFKFSYLRVRIVVEVKPSKMVINGPTSSLRSSMPYTAPRVQAECFVKVNIG